MRSHTLGFIMPALMVMVLECPCAAASPDEFFRQRGSDPDFATVMKSGDLPRGRNSTTGFKGSKVTVNDKLLRDGPNASRKIPSDIKLHTLGHSAIRRSEFERWSRWYQEDGNTQIFRLFKDEENVRNSRKLAARVETFSSLSWKRGEWHEWVGTYTILKPHGAAIFQAKNNENDWSVQLNMSDNGDIKLNHRRAKDLVIARDMVGKPFHIRVRDNGHDYEVYYNGELKGRGSYARPAGTTNFRWGLYLGGHPARHDMMILVTGAGIDPKGDDRSPARAPQTRTAPPALAPEPPPQGLPIPERVWTNADGGTLTAAGVFKPGSDQVHLRIDNEWIRYPLADLSDDDRAALRQAENFIGE